MTLVSKDSRIFWGMLSSAEGESQEEEDDFPGNLAEINVLLAHMGKGAVMSCGQNTSRVGLD